MTGASSANSQSPFNLGVNDTAYEPARLTLADLKTITRILVSKKQVEFIAYTCILSSQSAFFKAASSDQWETGRTMTVTLDDQEPEIFAIFLTWIVTGDMRDAAILVDIKPTNEPGARDSYKYQYKQLLKLYILGDYLQSPNFKNEVIDKIVMHAKLYSQNFRHIAGTNLSLIRMVYANTVAGSPLRRLLVDHVSRSSASLVRHEQGFQNEHYAEHIYEVANTLICNLQHKVPRQYPWAKDRCVYHEHPDQPKGYSCTNNNWSSGVEMHREYLV